MFLWNYAPGADYVNFVLTSIDPNTGFVYSKLDGRMYPPTSFIDQDSFIIHSTARFAAPAQDIFYVFIDESFLPDAKYAVIATPVGGSSPITNYEVRVVGHREQLLSLPAQLLTSRPTLAVITGREIGLDGLPIAGVKVCATLQVPGSQGQTTSGTVSGEVCTTTGVDGSWALSVIPTTSYGPGATYTVSKEHFSFGRREAGPLAITASGPVALDHLQILATIRDLEVAPPFLQVPLPEPVGGYCRVTGRVVDISGRPMGSVPVKAGRPGSFQKDSGKANSGGPPEVVEQLTLLESVQESTTTPNLIKTQSFMPGPTETLSVSVEAGSELITIVDGRGGVLSAPADFTFDRSSWVVTFGSPFFGVVKYRVPSDGRFSFMLLSGFEYWIQIGQNTLRRHFTVPAGAQSFDVSSLATPA